MASACRPADETTVTVYVPDAKLWEIDAPYLYTVTASCREEMKRMMRFRHVLECAQFFL